MIGKDCICRNISCNHDWAFNNCINNTNLGLFEKVGGNVLSVAAAEKHKHQRKKLNYCHSDLSFFETKIFFGKVILSILDKEEVRFMKVGECKMEARFGMYMNRVSRRL